MQFLLTVSFQVLNGVGVALLTHLAQNVDIRWEESTTDSIKILSAKTDTGVGKHDMIKTVGIIFGTNVTFSTPGRHGYSLSLEMLR